MCPISARQSEIRSVHVMSWFFILVLQKASTLKMSMKSGVLSLKRYAIIFLGLHVICCHSSVWFEGLNNVSFCCLLLWPGPVLQYSDTPKYCIFGCIYWCANMAIKCWVSRASILPDYGEQTPKYCIFRCIYWCANMAIKCWVSRASILPDYGEQTISHFKCNVSTYNYWLCSQREVQINDLSMNIDSRNVLGHFFKIWYHMEKKYHGFFEINLLSQSIMPIAHL